MGDAEWVIKERLRMSCMRDTAAWLNNLTAGKGTAGSFDFEGPMSARTRRRKIGRMKRRCVGGCIKSRICRPGRTSSSTRWWSVRLTLSIVATSPSFLSSSLSFSKYYMHRLFLALLLFLVAANMKKQMRGSVQFSPDTVPRLCLDCWVGLKNETKTSSYSSPTC